MRRRLDELRRAARLATVRGYEDNILQMAGSLAFTLVFAIFPALISVVAVLDLLGRFEPLVRDIADAVAEQPADSPWRVLENPIDAVLKGATPAWPMLILGLVITIWSAGNYIGNYQWAVARMRREPAGRSFLHQRLVQLALAVVAFVLVVLVGAVVLVAGPLASQVGDVVGLGDTTSMVWSLLRWPGMFVFVAVLFAVFYQVAPEARREGVGLFTTGSVVAVLGWLIVTVGFSIYVDYFADYNRIYGTLGAFIAFLVWLWLFNVALLASTEIDAALEDMRGGLSKPPVAGDERTDED